MKEKIEARIVSLEAEHAKGLEMLAGLQVSLANIAGAILVCKELLEDEQ